MGICNRKYLLLTICILQLIFTAERQIFDFLGYLWISILFNFFQLLFCIFGFYGAYQHSLKYIFSYFIWTFIWFTWNIFLICLYLDVGVLDHETNKAIKLDPESASWWKESGPGCKVIISTNNKGLETRKVQGCLVDYIVVEVVQSSIQVFLASLSLLTTVCLGRTYFEKDDACTVNGDTCGTRKPSNLYTIELVERHHERNDSDSAEYGAAPVSPKPMTPRRVKRRSVMTRGTTSRHSTSSRRSTGSRRSNRGVQGATNRMPGRWEGHTNPSYQQSSTHSLNDPDLEHEDLEDLRPPSARSSYSNFHGARPMSGSSYQQPVPSQPQYYNYYNHATAQVPQKRIMSFFNNGPPAYTDTETPI